MSSVPATAAPPSQRSRRTTNILAGTLALLTVLGLTAWVLHRIAYVHVADARIAATMITLSSRVDGRIETLPAGEGQRVEQGQLLLGMDDREARLLLAQRNAELRRLEAEANTLKERQRMVDALTASRLENRRSEFDSAQARLRAAQSEHERAAAEWERAASMFEREIVSRQHFEARRNDHLQARSALEAATADLSRARAGIREAEAERAELRLLEAELEALTHRMDEARAQRDHQVVIVDEHQVRAPEHGVIDQVFIERGEHVHRGQRLLILHNPDDLWVSANVKETELRHLDQGATARVAVDAYPGVTLRGRVTRIGSAATSEFALLPAPNPSGNFTKITQRVKIRIDLDDTQGLHLRPGMMVGVSIDK